jgi:hypothetical protein
LFLTSLQHSGWCFYTILTAWEKLWKEESKERQNKPQNDHKIKIFNIHFFNGATSNFQFSNAMQNP